MASEESNLSNVVIGMRTRAKFARRSAYVMVGILVVIGAAIGYTFLRWSDSPHIVVSGRVCAGLKIIGYS